jgi:hypothetical protein
MSRHFEFHKENMIDIGARRSGCQKRLEESCGSRKVEDKPHRAGRPRAAHRPWIEATG